MEGTDVAIGVGVDSIGALIGEMNLSVSGSGILVGGSTGALDRAVGLSVKYTRGVVRMSVTTIGARLGLRLGG